MSSRFGFQKMDVYLLARELAVVVHAAKISHRELREQAERAVVGCFLQLSEGLPNDSQGMRRRYFTIARNSLYEVAAAIDLANRTRRDQARRRKRRLRKGRSHPRHARGAPALMRQPRKRVMASGQ